MQAVPGKSKFGNKKAVYEVPTRNRRDSFAFRQLEARLPRKPTNILFHELLFDRPMRHYSRYAEESVNHVEAHVDGNHRDIVSKPSENLHGILWKARNVASIMRIHIAESETYVLPPLAFVPSKHSR